MSLIEPIGTAGTARGTPSGNQSVSARSGAEKVQLVQSQATAQAAAPIETMRAVVQVQASESKQLTDPLPRASAPVPPMAAVILHELRLQRELADLQERKDQAAV